MAKYPYWLSFLLHPHSEILVVSLNDFQKWAFLKNLFLGKKNYLLYKTVRLFSCRFFTDTRTAKCWTYLLYKTVRLFSCRFFTDTRTAKCWTKITNNRCEEAINGAVSLETCCNTVGKGWGSPCTECPAKTGGMLLSLELRVFFFFF